MSDEKVFDPRALAAESKKIHVLEDEDGQILYTCFTGEMAVQTGKVSDLGDRSILMTFLMMKGAYPELSLDDVKSWPAHKLVRISQKLAQDPSVSGEKKP